MEKKSNPCKFTKIVSYPYSKHIGMQSTNCSYDKNLLSGQFLLFQKMEIVCFRNKFLYFACGKPSNHLQNLKNRWTKKSCYSS